MTNSVDRSTPPGLKTAQLPQINIPALAGLRSSEPVHVPVEEEVFRIDIVFNSGTLHQPEKQILAAIQSLVFSGTDRYSEEEIMNSLDSFGAYYSCESTHNSFTISLFSTPELIESAYPMFIHAIEGACFPEDKLALYIERKIAELSQNREKTRYQANTLANELFYATPLLSKATDESHFRNLSTSVLNQHFKQIKYSGATVFTSGNGKGLPISSFTGNWSQKIATQPKTPTFKTPEQRHYHIHKAEAVQTSLVARTHSIGKMHKDYPALVLANTLFGGFFGSLLMQNIREERGLTYGIHSALHAQGGFSVLSISTDIKTDHVELVIEQIDKELEALRGGQFSDDLFSKTQNYLLGAIAKSCDDLFSNLDKTKVIAEQGLPSGFYPSLFESIRNCTKSDVSQAAGRHINPDTMLFVSCGPEQY